MPSPISVGKIDQAIAGIASTLQYAAEITVNKKGKMKAELTEEGLKDFFKMNKQYTKTMRDAVGMVHKTMARRQNLGKSGSLKLDVGKMFDVVRGFFDTHLAKKGDALSLSAKERDGAGKNVKTITKSSALKRLAALDFDKVASPQQFQLKGAAIRTYLLGRAITITKSGSYDTWLSEDDLHAALEKDLDSGKISQDFATACEKTFYYAAQYIYRGRATSNDRTGSICRDMQNEFQRALNRMSGAKSKTGKAINKIDMDEVSKWVKVK